jgi:predicted metal-dependent phosphoesterase TrpH
MIKYLKEKKNFPYFIILIIGIIIRTSKYGFVPTILGFEIITLFGFLAGLIIPIFIKQKNTNTNLTFTE